MAEGGGLLNRCRGLNSYPGFESLPHRQSLAFARSWRFGRASGIARLASLLATRHESHHRIHSVLAVRQGFGIARLASLIATRHESLPHSLLTPPIPVAPQWPFRPRRRPGSATRVLRRYRCSQSDASRLVSRTNAPTLGRRHLTVPVGPADAELPVHQIENRPTSARSSRRTVTRPLPTSKTIRYVRGSKLVRRSQADPQTTAHHGLRQNAFGLNRPAYVGNSRSPVRYTFTR